MSVTYTVTDRVVKCFNRNFRRINFSIVSVKTDYFIVPFLHKEKEVTDRMSVCKKTPNEAKRLGLRELPYATI
jgi:hypothetical protein